MDSVTLTHTLVHIPAQWGHSATTEKNTFEEKLLVKRSLLTYWRTDSRTKMVKQRQVFYYKKIEQKKWWRWKMSLVTYSFQYKLGLRRVSWMNWELAQIRSRTVQYERFTLALATPFSSHHFKGGNTLEGLKGRRRWCSARAAEHFHLIFITEPDTCTS